MNQEPNTPQSISRRELLKKIGAAGAVLGARAIVPVNWATPASESGLLPVHAQISGIGIVNGEIWEQSAPVKPGGLAPQTAAQYTASIDGTVLSNNATYTGLNDGYRKFTFSITNVPIGSRTVRAHPLYLCPPPDQTQVIIVGPGANNMPTPFIFDGQVNTASC